MATRRRGVKHSHSKTRSVNKALLRKTTYKNKKNKHHKTKKVYQSGGGPKPPAKGKEGDMVEFKVPRSLRRRGLGNSRIVENHIEYKKRYPTAEFDIPIEVSGLPYNISVKSVKQKTPGQQSYSIMSGDARRFLSGIGLGKEPYHMIIGIRQPHPTHPNRKKIVGSEIDLRKYRSVLFGNASEDNIKSIVQKANELTQAYYENSTTTKPHIDAFNRYLKGLNSKLQLAPKKENLAKKRAARVQASFTFNPTSPRTAAHSTAVDLSSMENSQASSPGDEAGAAGEALELQLVNITKRSSRPLGTSSRSRGASSRSRGTSARSGISKQPTPQVSYYRSFKPRVRDTTQPFSTIPEEP